jgi:transcriptional regulator with XRE-family HTH domain
MCERDGMMDLSTYLTTTGTSQRAFAEKVGISPSFLNELLRTDKEPGLETAQRIATETEGAVPLSAWPKLAALLAAARGAA